MVSSLSLDYFLWFTHSLQATFSSFLAFSRLFIWFPHSLQATFSDFLFYFRHSFSDILTYFGQTFSDFFTRSRLLLSLVASVTAVTRSKFPSTSTSSASVKVVLRQTLIHFYFFTMQVDLKQASLVSSGKIVSTVKSPNFHSHS